MVAGISTYNPEPIPLDEVAAMLREHRGNLARTATALAISRGSLVSRVQANPPLQEIVAELRENILDKAEDNIFKEVEQGDAAASRFVLQTLGKDRGWVTRQENSNKEPLEITVRTFSDKVPSAEDQDQAGS